MLKAFNDLFTLKLLGQKTFGCLQQNIVNWIASKRFAVPTNQFSIHIVKFLNVCNYKLIADSQKYTEFGVVLSCNEN